MADNNNNQSTPSNSSNQSIADFIEVTSLTQEGLLQSIALDLKAIVRNDGVAISQSSLKDMMIADQRNDRIIERQRRARGYPDPRKPQNQGGQGAQNTQGNQQTSQSNTTYQRRRSTTGSGDFFDLDRRSGRARAGRMWEHVVDSFEETLIESITGSRNPLDNVFRNMVDGFQRSLNVDRVENLGPEVARRILNQLDNIPFQQHFGNRLLTNVGDQLRGEFRWFADGINNILNTGMRTVTGALQAQWEDIDFFADMDIGGVFSAFSDFNRRNDEPQVRDITDVRRSVERGLGNVHQGEQELFQLNREGVNYMADRMDNNTQEIVNAIWQSNGGQGQPELGNEFDDVGDNIQEALEGDYREVGEQRALPTHSAQDVVSEVIDQAGNLLNVVDVGGSGIGAAGDAASGLAEGALQAGASEAALASTASEATTALATVAEAGAGVAAAFPEITLILMALSLVVEGISEAINRIIGPAADGINNFISALQKAGNRQLTINQKYQELYQKRLEDDLRSIREAAYAVIQDAANRVEQVWDSVESTISATQDYTKAEVQDGWSEFAARLQREDLSKYVSSADIMEKLEYVLKQGLTGKAAEEFAYQATLLNQMIPTEDFFQYAASYASIIAQTISSGGNLAGGISVANDALQDFANSLLYAKKENDGLTTTLSGTSDLFTKAAEIAITSQSTNRDTLSSLSTTLAMLSGAVGSVAPDLANGIVDAVYRAAVGGNSSEITALRSLAGTGASNTAFLKALVGNPQEVLKTMFENLSILQARGSANYMEVAEGLSSVFGISMDALSRLDFQKLADKIGNATVDAANTYLTKAEERLKAGDTTSKDSQNRIAKINEYMMEEGLAYVLDNEVARSIQEHMWQEQLAREIESASYSVDLIGGARSALLGIETTLRRYVAYSLGLGWVEELANVALTVSEATAINTDTARILKAGVIEATQITDPDRVARINAGRDAERYALTTGNEDLGLATPIITLLGGGAPTVLGGSSPTDTGTTIVRTVQSFASRVAQAIKSGASTILGNNGDSTGSTAGGSGTVGGNSVPRRKARRGTATSVEEALNGSYAEQEASMSNTGEDIGHSEEDVFEPGNPSDQYQEPDTTEPADTVVVQPAIDIGELAEELGPLVPPGETTELIANVTGKIGKAAGNNYAKVIKQSNEAVATATKRTQAALENGFSQLIKGVEYTSLQSISKDDLNAIRNVTNAYRTYGAGGGGYRALYEDAAETGTSIYEKATQKTANQLSELINSSLEEYILKGREAALSLENFRHELTEDSTNMLTEQLAADLKALEEEGEGRGLQHRGYYDQSQLMEEVFAKSAEIAAEEQSISFENWLANFEAQTGIANLSSLLTEYGTTIDAIRDAYDSQEAAKQSAATKARDLHEVQFWEDMQNFATVDFPWYMREWERYFIQHEAYTEATAEAYNEAVALAVEEKGEMGDSVLALAEALTENTIWQQELGNAIKDPTIQTNAILSKILLCVEAIMQQNNETAIVAVPTALSSLGLGISNV